MSAPTPMDTMMEKIHDIARGGDVVDLGLRREDKAKAKQVELDHAIMARAAHLKVQR